MAGENFEKLILNNEVYKCKFNEIDWPKFLIRLHQQNIDTNLYQTNKVLFGIIRYLPTFFVREGQGCILPSNAKTVLIFSNSNTTPAQGNYPLKFPKENINTNMICCGDFFVYSYVKT